MATNYTDRLLAYIDILGWSQATDTVAPSFLFEVLQPVIDRAQFNSQPHRDALIEELGDRVNPLMLEVQFGFFSDCMVLSVPNDHRGRIYDNVAHFIVAFLQNGFAVRGGITTGNLYHKDQVIFGPALVKAYQIESTRAKFARVLIDEEAMAITGFNDESGAIRDHLGNWVVDPFRWIAKPHDPADMRGMLTQFFDPEKIIAVISGKIDEYRDRKNVLDTWRYQAKLCAISLGKYGAPAEDWIRVLEGLSKVE